MTASLSTRQSGQRDHHDHRPKSSSRRANFLSLTRVSHTAEASGNVTLQGSPGTVASHGRSDLDIENDPSSKPQSAASRNSTTDVSLLALSALSRTRSPLRSKSQTGTCRSQGRCLSASAETATKSALYAIASVHHSPNRFSFAVAHLAKSSEPAGTISMVPDGAKKFSRRSLFKPTSRSGCGVNITSAIWLGAVK